MDFNLRAIEAATIQRSIIIAVAILIVSFCLSTVISCNSYSNVLSKPPIISPIDSQAVVNVYIQEFRLLTEEYYWVPVSPDQKWELYIERENTSTRPGGFFSLRLREKTGGDARILFTLWDADVDSGVRANVRWSKDAKALQINGDTRGFSFTPRPHAMKYESFNFIYLVEEDRLYSVPTRGA